MCDDLDGLPGYLFSEADHQELRHEELEVKHAEAVAEQQESPSSGPVSGPQTSGETGALS
jgi:hypothetical protein